MTAVWPRSRPAPSRLALPDSWPRPGRLLGRHWPVVVLVVVPLLIFGVPAAAGHPLIWADNQIQNYPLRVLVGDELRHGHLPLWDPLEWSGTGLLGGFNAGAMYPPTLLFAILPPPVAWVINQALVYILAGTGMWAFLRHCGISATSALLGALVFTYGGVMSGQAEHIDMVEAMSLAPWMLLGVRGVALSSSWDKRWRWGLLLAAGYGLVVLTGSPESMIDLAVLVAVYAVGLAWGHRERWAGMAVTLGAAGVVALALGAAQLVPGLAWIERSQRAQLSFRYVSGGSMPPSLSLLALNPFLLGGYRRLGASGYIGPLNLPEWTSYVGILPVVAALFLLGRRWRDRIRTPEWPVWYAIILVGLVLALGGHTPLFRLIYRIPLVGHQRLPNRNLVDLDLGLSVLLALWLDAARRPLSGLRRRLRWDWVAAGLPAAVTLGLLIALVAAPVPFVRAMGVPPSRAHHPYWLVPAAAAAFVLAAGGGALALALVRTGGRRWRRMTAAFVVGNVGLFAAASSWGGAARPGVLTGNLALGQELGAAAGWGGQWQSPGRGGLSGHNNPGRQGRYAIFDPLMLDFWDESRLDQPDLNIFHGVPSVQGYGAIVGASYNAATQAHDQATLGPQDLAGTVFDKLNLRAFATLPAYFLQPLSVRRGPEALTSSHPGNPVPSLTPAQAGRARIAVGHRDAWYFGAALDLRQVGITVTRPATVRVGTLSSTGTTHWVATVRVAGNATAAIHPVSAIGLVVADDTGAPVTVTRVTVDSAQGAFRLAGVLHDSVQPPHWRFDGRHQGWAFFLNERAAGWVWTRTPAGSVPTRASTRIVAGPVYSPTTVAVSSAHPVDLVRSVAYAPGWFATVRPDPGRRSGRTVPGAPGRQVAVRADGILQSVRVPAGRHLVTYHYEPASVLLSLIVSLVAALLLLAGAAVVAGRQLAGRRRRGATLGTGREPESSQLELPEVAPVR